MALTIPSQPQDVFELANNFLVPNSSSFQFVANTPPSVSGFGTQQSRVPNERTAVSTRKLMHWLIPEGPIVQMYINPQNVRYSYKKLISSTRTKGGYVLQYWGEELTNLSLSGTTGTSGIEGINVLLDVYRNEQLALDPYALFQAAKSNQDNFSGNIFGLDSALNGIDGFVTSILGAAQSPASSAINNTPTLAFLAFTVELYWSGEVYRGYFSDFSVDESADKLGLFDYNISFTVTQKRGFRQNFLAWHRSAVSGPSDSNPITGTPHSFGYLGLNQPTPARNSSPQITNETLQERGNNLGFGIL